MLKCLLMKIVLFGLCLLVLSAPVTSFVVSSLARCPQTVLYSTPGFKQSIIADNRQAKGDYEFEEYYHGGIQLRGSEVKSCRMKGSCNLKSGFIEIREGEAWLYEVHIAEATRCGPIYQHEPKRTRKVLLHSKEILKLEQRVLQRNMELIPTELYWSDKNFVKVEIGVGKKKTINDKRDDMIKKDGQASIRRVMKGGFD